MSNAVYPTLPGIAFNVTRSPIFKTDVRTTPSGREFRAAQMLYPIYRYSLQYEFLRDTATFTELRTLLGFFNARQGAFDSFLFTDPDDNSVTTQAFGTGDGTTTQFQLVRTLGGNTEPVYDLNGTPSIFKAGVLQTAGSAYSINSTGLVTFTAAPGAGQALTWTGSFYWRCRFADDRIDLGKFMATLWEAKRVEFLTVKP